MDADSNNMDVSACDGCAERDRRIGRLEDQVKQLQQQIEGLSRSGKRQAAPFSRGLPKADPKLPGRKSGEDYGTKAHRVVPQTIDEVHEAPLPARCPRCGGGQFIGERIEHQYQVDLPRKPIHRQFNVAVAYCTCCNKRVQGRHRLQTSDALGCCASQIGPNAQAAVVLLNKELGVSQGKISRFLKGFFHIQLTRGGSCQIMLRAAERCKANYQAIVQRVQVSPSIVPDETGWRVGGRLAWMHVAVGTEAVAYLIHRARGFEASALLIGAGYAGAMTCDGYASYLRFIDALHQTCLDHLIRRCRAMIEQANGMTRQFPSQVMALLRQGLATRNQREAGEITLAQSRACAAALERQMEKLLASPRRNLANRRLANHLWKHLNSLFTFLQFEGIDATNHKAEQAIRPAVVNRKVWGGNRTQTGAQAQSILMSVIFTALRQKRDALTFLTQLLTATPGQRPMLVGTG